MSVFLSRLTEQISPVNYVGYLESSGTQWLDTEYKATSENYRIKCNFTITNSVAGKVLFGGGASTDIISALLNTTTQLKFYVGSGSVSGVLPTFAQGTEYEMECHANNGTLTVNLNGTTYSGSYSGAINKDYSLGIFANNVSGTGSQHSSARFTKFQIYDNDVLARDLRPCYDPDGVACAYDKVSKRYFYNKGTGSFVAGGVVESSVTFLEYIESSGTQYIDTEFVPNQDTRIVMEAMPTSVVDAGAGTGFIPYGAAEAYNSKAFECYTSGSKFEFNYANQYDFIGTPVAGQKITIDHNKNVATVTTEAGDKWTITFDYSAFEAPRAMTLFAIARSTVIAGPMRLYFCKIYDNGVLVRDLWPCYDPAGVASMYDKVSKRYFYNKGTGEFIAGGVAA